jgi:hypothetical protein
MAKVIHTRFDGEELQYIDHDTDELKWVNFYFKGRPVFGMTVEGLGAGEITATRELTAQENQTTPDRVRVWVERNSGGNLDRVVFQELLPHLFLAFRRGELLGDLRVLSDGVVLVRAFDLINHDKIKEAFLKENK